MTKAMFMILYFVRELIFDSKEEYNIKSHKFNTRKVSVVVLMGALFLLCFLLMNRIYAIAQRNLDLAAQLELCRSQDLIEGLEAMPAPPVPIKKQRVPSDSRKGG